MRPSHWRCAACKQMKKLPEEIERADLRAVCRACKTSLSSHPASTDAAAGIDRQQVTVHRRGFVRRHSTDNRDTE